MQFFIIMKRTGSIILFMLFTVSVMFVSCKKEPTADFTADNTSVFAFEEILFTDLSVDKPTSWNWKFSNSDTSMTSAEQSPKISFRRAGSYDVSLEVKNSKGSNSVTKTGYITVKPNLIFWSKSSVIFDVYLSTAPLDSNNYLGSYQLKGQITTPIQNIPVCGATEGLNFSLSGKIYYFAKGNQIRETGSINITNGACNNIQISN